MERGQKIIVKYSSSDYIDHCLPSMYKDFYK